MSLKDNALRAAVLKAIADALKAEVDAGRDDLMHELLGLYDATGAKSLDVKVGDVKVASIPLSIPKAGIEIADADALDAWIADRYPDCLVEVPAKTVVSSVVREAVVKSAVRAFDSGDVMTEDGELIDGLIYKEAGRPKSFSIRFEPDGRNRIAAAWQDGTLGALMPGIAPTAPLALSAAVRNCEPLYPSTRNMSARSTRSWTRTYVPTPPSWPSSRRMTPRPTRSRKRTTRWPATWRSRSPSRTRSRRSVTSASRTTATL
jgi:hypothetical protein